MKKRRCHAYEVPEIGLGTNNTFDIRTTSDLDDRKSLLIKTRDLGAGLVDSSPVYGEVEKVIGKALPDDKSDYMISTKVWTSGKRAGLNQIIQSFAFLQTPFVHILHIHNMLDWETHIETIEKMQDDDKVGLAAISNSSANSYPEMIEVMETERVQVVQVPYNILDQKAAEEIFPVAEKYGQGVMIMMPFNQGSLFRFKRRSKIEMEPLEAVGIKTWSQALLAWILTDDRVGSVVPATINVDHLLENVGASGLPKLDEDLKKHIESEAARCLV
ncbi:MAG: aldo/keto reductase [Candidatus Hodarchaeales archaeon]|jgi:aryl-alcohol dehydrogenase-like predicted oxidoreductase